MTIEYTDVSERVLVFNRCEDAEGNLELRSSDGDWTITPDDEEGRTWSARTRVDGHTWALDILQGQSLNILLEAAKVATGAEEFLLQGPRVTVT